MFELEVPEIQTGEVEIKGIVREAGYRTKIAVTSKNPSLDCVGACVGNKGMRVNAIVNELNGEKLTLFLGAKIQQNSLLLHLAQQQFCMLAQTFLKNKFGSCSRW